MNRGDSPQDPDLWLHTAVRLLVLVLLAAPTILTGCGGGESPLAAQRLRIASGTPGGVYAAYGQGLAKAITAHVPRLTATAQPSDGSVENLRRLAAGRTDLAFSLADSAADAAGGRGRFSRRVPLRALGRLYDNYVQIIVRDDSPIRAVADLARRPVSIGAPGSGTALIAERLLTLSGLDGARGPRRARLDIAASARALAARSIDAFFWSGGLPTEAIVDLQRGEAIRLLDLRGLARKLRERHSDVYTESVVPRRVYGLRSAVTTVTVPNLLVVLRDMPDEMAYRLTRMLFAGHGELTKSHPEAGRLDARSGYATQRVRLHPGAERWYRESLP